ncbi:RNA pseudouridine synthase [candidate division WOR-1 bacterium RIFCSPHIGHO2_02_FULL_45_12]|uniref:Pseudouridine synthase n=1 Tax=candidate division WOR-1 bacterium RIFCSPLOWO2_12_FULL_45_9 TaxID=1802568 RepID=A0A1F4RLK8_UNCSA|nr:MAG: RNA pseudouridine synthase [candidate division WOR-1 bacterium RIFCSPHIGHO2_02_FULL_45_12]OGC09060.1 MAG: RNA pseudouridine synthase [candidate division WOR-1 bacterium RIFCSPLOWO2_12_FULL_45_9]
MFSNKVFEYVIAQEEEAKRLDSFLSLKKELGLTRSQVQRFIEDGFIKVNKVVAKSSHKLKTDDRVVIEIPPPKKLEVDAENIPLDIVFEDKDLIVINKPRSLVVHPAVGNYSGTLVNALLAHCHNLSGIGGVLRPGIVHRLDKDTSGLIVVAKSDLAHQALANQFKAKEIFKQYLALVHGKLKQAEGIIEANVGRHPRHRKRMAVMGVGGREAITQYKVINSFSFKEEDYSLVELILKTGRTHQIRIHMNSIGHSIVGDPAYGHRREVFRLTGQLLHSAKLGLTHPRTKKYMEFSADIPGDMERILKILQKK